ncbi:MAG: ATP-dependent Clp protease proteolytic subunit [Deltaproteobacteria bacterium]|nr:ATP-dependent Clp protease proteolytic subunit [Deltaproteobacteria bacterium]
MWRLDDDDSKDDDKDQDNEKGFMQQMLKSRTIFVAEEVSDKLYKKVASTITLLEQADAVAPIYVYVNSPGGSADSGFAIYDLLRFTSCPIITLANGIVASSAVLIYLAGEQERLALPHARFLLHQPSTYARGQASDIDITAKEIRKIRDRYNMVVEKHTGKPMATVQADADRDFWLNAEESVKYGLVQRIVEHKSELNNK